MFYVDKFNNGLVEEIDYYSRTWLKQPLFWTANLPWQARAISQNGQ